MNASPETLHVVRQWVQKAENDLRTAEHMLTLDERCPTDVVCFHAQQCVEKYLKALLSLQGTEFPKTHSIGTLVALLPEPQVAALTAEDQERLTDFATVTRYPGDYDPISLPEARDAVVRVVRRVREQLRRALPETVLETTGNRKEP
jgi:HEPN domain-containing protein